MSLFNYIIDKLAARIAFHLTLLKEQNEWLKEHRSSLIRAKAIAQIECPENSNNLEYLIHKIKEG